MSRTHWGASLGLTVQARILSGFHYFSWKLSGTRDLSMMLLCGQKMDHSLSSSAWVIREFSYTVFRFKAQSDPPSHTRTGYGQHADYVFGWEGDSLQRAMEVCFGGEGIATNCPALKVQETDAMNACRQGAKVPEITEGQCKRTPPTPTVSS